MSADITIVVDGVPRRVPAGTTLAAALFRAGVTAFRRDLSDAPRAPLCGMGTCFECRVVVDGVAETRSCLVGVREGMRVETGQ
ncbi:MAG TPA: (2Fe-2S)-binding protein [Gemmatimonadales bacterium]|jgi:sarcosine oxidase subunit alpha|nr:(2Fe-2S)-binding protein [Gemmatimonadales bacterium]